MPGNSEKKRKSEEHAKLLSNLHIVLRSDAAIQALSRGETGVLLQAIRQGMGGKGGPLQLSDAQIHDLVGRVVSCHKTSDPTLHSAHQSYKRILRQAKAPEKPTHHEKRDIGRIFHITHSSVPKTFSELCTAGDILCVERAPFFHPKIKSGRHLVDKPDQCREYGDRAVVCDTQNGFHVVGEDESVIFYSVDDAGNTVIELAVVRDAVPSQKANAIVFADFFEFMNCTAYGACHSRRNSRPTHPGTLVQAGLNAGPRHARVFGIAKSFVKNLDDTEKRRQDEAVIAFGSVLWALARSSLMPREIIDTIDHCLEESQLPQMMTRHVPPGTGFHFTCGEKDYSFPICPRSPPELYFGVNYVAKAHTDKMYSPFTIGLCTGRSPAAQPVGNKRPYAATEVFGGNFVDVRLGVKVMGKANTLTAFRPAHLHGTTPLVGIEQVGGVIGFSQRVIDSYQIALAAGNVHLENSWGTGNVPGGDEE